MASVTSGVASTAGDAAKILKERVPVTQRAVFWLVSDFAVRQCFLYVIYSMCHIYALSQNLLWKHQAQKENTHEARLRRALISGRRNLLHAARNFSMIEFEVEVSSYVLQVL